MLSIKCVGLNFLISFAKAVGQARFY